METLDGDGKKLRHSNGRVCQRDIVQFVPFRQCNLNGEVLAQ